MTKKCCDLEFDVTEKDDKYRKDISELKTKNKKDVFDLESENQRLLKCEYRVYTLDNYKKETINI